VVINVNSLEYPTPNNRAGWASLRSTVVRSVANVGLARRPLPRRPVLTGGLGPSASEASAQCS
jgi:hypothetical protein